MAQALDLLREIFGWPALLALAASLVLAVIASKLMPSGMRGEFLLPCAVASGFVAGYATLPASRTALWEASRVIVAPHGIDTKPLWEIIGPNQAWQWLPYLGLIAAAFALISPPQRAGSWKLSFIASGGIAAATLAPSWPVLGFARHPQQIFLLAYFLVTIFPLDYLPSRLLNRVLPTLLVAVSVALAIASGVMVSARLAQLAALAAGALAGGWMATFFVARYRETDVRSLLPLYAVLAGGATWCACVEPDPPQLALLVIPLLPLALWPLAAAQIPFAPRKIS